MLSRGSLLLVLAPLAGCGPAPSAAPPAARALPPASSAAPAPPATASATTMDRSAPLAFAEPPVRGPIGTPDPILVTAAGASGRWVAFCQARKDTNGDGRIGVAIGPHGDAYGDAIEPYLKVGDTPEEAIDEVVTADRTGRYLVVVQRGRLVLVDAETGARVDLSARGGDAAGNPSPLATHGAASLDAGGTRVLYRTAAPPPKKNTASKAPKGPAARLAVLDIASGKETLIDPGTGTLLRARLDGPWVVMTVRVGGSAGHVMTTFAPRRCRGPAASYSVFATGGTEEREVRVARASGGAARAVPGFVAVAGERLLRRNASGALLLEDADGRSTPLVGEACAGRVLGIHGPSERVLVACKDGSLSVHGAGAHETVATGRDTDDREDAPYPAAPLVHVLDQSSPDLVVDVERGKARSFTFARTTHSDGVVTMRGRRILLRRETGLFLTDFDSNEEFALPGAIEKYPATRVNGRVAYVEPLLVDMDAAALLGSTGRGVEVFAVLASGHMLATPERKGAYVLNAFPPGPVAWTWADRL